MKADRKWMRVAVGGVLFYTMPVPAGENLTCDIKLLAPAELTRQIDQRTRETSSWLARRQIAQTLEKMKPELEARIVSLCNHFEHCSAEDITYATSSVLNETLTSLSETQLIHALRPYSLLVGALAANTALQMFIAHYFSTKTTALLSSSITTLTAILVVSLGAPILERLQNRVRKWALQTPHSTTIPNTADHAQTIHLPNFERTYWQSQAIWGIPGASGRGINRNFVGEIRFPLSMAALMAQLDPINGMEKAAAIVAQLLFDVHSYPELDPVNFADQAHIWFGKFYITTENFETFTKNVMSYLEVLESRVTTEPKFRDEYLKILYSWFRPRLRCLSTFQLER